MALLHIIDASGRKWQSRLAEQTLCTIGRAPDNTVILNDPRASRYHAHIKSQNNAYVIVDGRDGRNAQRQPRLRQRRAALRASAARRRPRHHRRERTALRRSDEVKSSSSISYDDKPLGHTQLYVSASDVIKAALQPKPDASAAAAAPPNEELEALRRKAKILALLYEMSKTLGSVFNLDAIFDKATEIIFSATPADRVVALLTDESASNTANTDDAELNVVAMRFRDEQRAEQSKQQTIGRTITRKVMRERAALLSQDAAADMEFANVHSIVSQGVRSTICAPLVAESGVHGALYADRLDAFTSFSRDDLELVSAVAAQTAVAVENARAHERLAREEVARANYGRFLPEYVVKQILENPELVQTRRRESNHHRPLRRHPRLHAPLRARAAGKGGAAFEQIFFRDDRDSFSSTAARSTSISATS